MEILNLTHLGVLWQVTRLIKIIILNHVILTIPLRLEIVHVLLRESQNSKNKVYILFQGS